MAKYTVIGIEPEFSKFRGSNKLKSFLVDKAADFFEKKVSEVTSQEAMVCFNHLHVREKTTKSFYDDYDIEILL